MGKWEIPKNFEAPGRYIYFKILSRAVGYYSYVKGKFNTEAEPIHLRKFIDDYTLKNKKSSDELIQIDDRIINGINVRYYKPCQSFKATNLPIFIYYHGGGFFLGNTYLMDLYLIGLSLNINCVVISVNYRMAPEHPFPIPIEDCYNLTKYVLESRNEFGDTDKVIISGDSAGGNITCVVSQRLNAENVKKPILQVLIYPWTQMFNNRTPSAIRYEKAIFRVGKPVAWYLGITDPNVAEAVGKAISLNHHINLITDENIKEKFKSYTDHSLIPEEFKAEYKYYKKYENIEQNKIFPQTSKHSEILQADSVVTNLVKKIFTPEFSPGLADDEVLKGLPDALFVMAEYDPLKDEGLIYAQRLKSVGVNVDINFYETAYHGISVRIEENTGYQIAREMHQDMITWIKKKLNNN